MSDMCPAFEIDCSMHIHIYYSMLQSFLFIVVFLRPFLQSDINMTVLVTGSLIALKGAHVLLALVLSFWPTLLQACYAKGCISLLTHFQLCLHSGLDQLLAQQGEVLQHLLQQNMEGLQ